MNPIAEEIESYYGCGSETDKEVLEHYGMPRNRISSSIIHHVVVNGWSFDYHE